MRPNPRIVVSIAMFVVLAGGIQQRAMARTAQMWPACDFGDYMYCMGDDDDFLFECMSDPTQACADVAYEQNHCVSDPGDYIANCSLSSWNCDEGTEAELDCDLF